MSASLSCRGHRDPLSVAVIGIGCALEDFPETATQSVDDHAQLAGGPRGGGLPPAQDGGKLLDRQIPTMLMVIQSL
jgi:hypothetical protein